MSKHHKLSGGVHRKIWEEANGKIPPGHHIHHVDGNPYNNELSNLVCLTAEEHAAIHSDQFTRWATVGGKMGGDKCKEQGLGWFAATQEERKERSLLATSHRKIELDSERRKQEYASGRRKHWTTFYTKEEVSSKISAGDPGKSHRDKEPWNKGKKMQLKDRETTNNNKRIAALNRVKLTCECCDKLFDPGNLKRHLNSKQSKRIAS